MIDPSKITPDMQAKATRIEKEINQFSHDRYVNEDNSDARETFQQILLQ